MADFVDPYLDPDTGILRNFIGATTAVQLGEIEAQLVFANETELNDLKISRTNDLTELCAIHAQLFKGVYDWAGKIRTVDIRKNHEGAGFFVPVSYISRASDFVFRELAESRNLKGVNRDSFVERLAYFYDQLNYIHPFREGNGRTQRVFWTRVASDAGFLIDWDGVIGNENDQASGAAAEDDDRSGLLAMFGRIVRKI